MFDLTPDMNSPTGVIRRRRATSVATTIDVCDACACSQAEYYMAE